MVRQSRSVRKDMRRFAFRFAGELWQADAMHGPRVADDRGRKRKTCLLAILDDATRVIPYARFSFADNTPAFLLVLRGAITRRGLAARLYVDNGSNFRSRQLAMICARLGIALLHARPYHDAGRERSTGFSAQYVIRPWPRSTRRTTLTGERSCLRNNSARHCPMWFRNGIPELSGPMRSTWKALAFRTGRPAY